MGGMVPQDVYELTGVTDPRLSPDGTTVAYVVWTIDPEANAYRSAIWIARSDGSGTPRRFTAGDKRDASPRWSPDGSMLAFTSNRDGDECQLYVTPADGGEPKRLTDLKASVGEPEWSPDGTRIVFTSRVPDAAYEEEDEKNRPPRRFTRLWFKFDNEGWIGDRRQHVFAVVADGSAEPVQLTKGEFDHGHPSWSPDGTRVAFSAMRHDDWDIYPASDIYVVDAGGGEPELMTSTDGSAGTSSWTPDGSSIVYTFSPGVFDEPKHGQIAVLHLATRDRRILTASLDRTCAPYPPIREPIVDGADVVFAVEDHGNQHLYRVALDGSAAPVPIVEGDRQVTGYDIRDGRLVYAATGPVTLAGAVHGRRSTPAHRRGVGVHERARAVRARALRRDSADGTEVECWMMRPVGLEARAKAPTLLNIHGGPFTQYGNRFFDEFHVYTGAGYAVVYCNPRGSYPAAPRSGAARSAAPRAASGPAGARSTTQT